MVPLKLTSWSIRRSGANLAITGQDASGKARKITGVPQIYPAAGAHHPRPYGAGNDENRNHVRVELA